MSPEATYVLQSLGTVAVFGAAAWGAVWGLRRIGVSGAGGPMQVIARQPLDGRRAIYLVRVGKRVLIVGAADGSLTRLGTTTVRSLEISPDAPPERKSFGDVLARVFGRGKA